MLSRMETAVGLTIISAKGTPLRVLRTHPAFQAVKDLLTQALPSAQMWEELQKMVKNPISATKAVVDWATRFGVWLTIEGDTLCVSPNNLPKMPLATWLPLFERTKAVAGSPVPIMHLMAALGDHADKVDASQLCLHWDPILNGASHKLGIVMLRQVSDRVPVGGTWTDSSELLYPNRSTLVSYDDFTVDNAGNLALYSGKVLAAADDVEMGPCIMGYNRTYRTQEGSSEGWADDFSFDSLQAARANAVEIQKFGGEARILNAISGDIVPLSA